MLVGDSVLAKLLILGSVVVFLSFFLVVRLASSSFVFLTVLADRRSLLITVCIVCWWWPAVPKDPTHNLKSKIKLLKWKVRDNPCLKNLTFFTSPATTTTQVVGWQDAICYCVDWIIQNRSGLTQWYCPLEGAFPVLERFLKGEIKATHPTRQMGTRDAFEVALRKQVLSWKLWAFTYCI